MRYRFALIAIAAVATGIIAGVVIAGSGGGDGSSSDEVTVPELRPPRGSIRTETDKGTTADQGATTEATPDGSSGGAQAPPPQDQGGGAKPPEDTEQRDVPPPSGSPAERFEQFCQENPGAC